MSRSQANAGCWGVGLPWLLMCLVAVSVSLFLAQPCEAVSPRAARTTGTTTLPTYYDEAVTLSRMYYNALESPGTTSVPSSIPLLDYGALCKDDAYNILYYGSGNLAVMRQNPTTLELTLVSSRYAPDMYQSYCYFANKNQMYDVLFSLEGSLQAMLLSRASGADQRISVWISAPDVANPLDSESPRPSDDADRIALPCKPFGIDQTSTLIAAFDNGLLAFTDLFERVYAFAWSRMQSIRQIIPHHRMRSFFYVLGYTNDARREWTVHVYPMNPEAARTKTGNGTSGDGQIPVVDPISVLNSTVMDEINAACVRCDPLGFTAFDGGMVIVLSSVEQNAMYIARVDHWTLDVRPEDPEEVPQADWSTTTTTTTTTTSQPAPSEVLSGRTMDGKHTLVRQIIDEVCNVSFVMQDGYTNNILVSMACDSYGSQLVLLRHDQLTIVAHLTLSLPGSATPYIGLSGLVDTRSRTVKLLVPRIPSAQAIMDVSLVVPASVSPSVVVDGSTLVIRGYGFVPRMVCFFPDHNNTFVDMVFFNQSMVQCVVPPVVELAREPLRLQLQLMPLGIDSAAEMPNCDCSFLFQPVGNLSFLQVRKSAPQKAVDCVTNRTFAISNNLCLRVTGESFVEPAIAPNQKCKLYSELNYFHHFITNATFINSREIICQFGPEVTPLPDPVRVTISVDGELFSDVGPLFSVLGTPTTIVATSVNWQNDLNMSTFYSPAVEAITRADTTSMLPPIVISIVDMVNHVIWPMDFDGTLDGIIIGVKEMPLGAIHTGSSSESSDGETSVAAPVLRGTLQAPVIGNGTATFTDIYLECPRVSIMALQFFIVEVPETVPLLISATATVVVDIREGVPYTLKFVREPSPSVSPSVSFLSIQPIIGVSDICGNVFRTLKQTDVGAVDIIVQSYNFTSKAKYTTRWGLDPYNNLFYTHNVTVKGIHNKDYTISVEAPGLAVPQVSANRVHVAWCDANRLAVLDTGECLPCPEYATCNGTDMFLLQKGWWRPGESSTDFFNCRSLYDDGVCLQDGACKTGYTGIRCAQCEQGYRQVSNTCTRCPSKPMNSFLIFLTCLFFVLCSLAWVTLMAVLPPNTPLVWACKSLVFVIQFTALYNSIQFSWTTTARNLCTGANSMSDLITVVTSCSFTRAGSFVFLFVMPIVLWCVLVVLGRLVVLLFHFDRLDAHALVAIVIKAYSHMKCHEFLELRREVVWKYSPHGQLQSNGVSMRHPYAAANAVSGHNTLPLGESYSDQFEGSTGRSSQGTSSLQHPSHDGEERGVFIHELEARVVNVFESATGIYHRDLSEEQLCAALSNLTEAQLKSISSIQLPLPTRKQVERWTRMRHSRGGAANRRGDTGNRKVRTTNFTELDAGADSTVSIEENYRLLAVRQFRTNWLGLCLNEFATLLVVFYLPIVLAAFQWQQCHSLNYGVNDERRISSVDNSLSCDSSEYRSARNLGLVAIVLYGVVAPLLLLVQTVYYKTRYGLDVSVAVFPVLHFGLPSRAALYEFVVFAQKLVMAVAVAFSKRALLRAATLVWIVGARMLIDAMFEPYPIRHGDAPRLANLWGCLPFGRAIRCTNALLFLMANVVLIAAYVSQNEESTFHGGVARFLTALFAVFFAVALLMNVWLVIMSNVRFVQVRCGKAKRAKDTDRAALFQTLINIYARTCATKQYYADVCERGLEVTLYLDRIKRLNEVSPIDDDLLRTLADEEEMKDDDTARLRVTPQRRQGSSASVSSWSSQGGVGGNNTLSAAMRNSTTSAARTLPRVVSTLLPDALLRPIKEPPLPTLTNSDLVVSDDAVKEVAKGDNKVNAITAADDKSADGIAPMTSADAGRASAAAAAAAAVDKIAANVAAQFDDIPAPKPQPKLHRRDSALFSIRHLDQSPIVSDKPSRHKCDGADVPPLVAALVPFGGAPPPQPVPPAPNVTFQSFSRPPVELDLASTFDPFRVAPLRDPQTRTRQLHRAGPLVSAQGRRRIGLGASEDNLIAEEVEALGLDGDIVVRGSLLEVSGIDVGEMRSILDGAHISHGFGTADEDTGLGTGSGGGFDTLTVRSPKLPRDSPAGSPFLRREHGTASSPLSPALGEGRDKASPQPPPPLPTFRTISSRPQTRSHESRRPRTTSAPKTSKHRSSSKTKKK